MYFWSPKVPKDALWGIGAKYVSVPLFIHFAARQNFTAKQLHLCRAQTSLRIAELHLRVSEAVYGKGVVKQPSFSFDAFTLKRKRKHITKALGFSYHDGFAVHITLGVTEHITKAQAFYITAASAPRSPLPFSLPAKRQKSLEVR